MKRILMPALVVAALGAGVAHGKECKGVNFPDQAQVEGSNLTLNGLGLRQATAFKVNVYVAALYVAKTSSDPNALLGSNTPSELILQFVRNVGADDLRKGWSEGFEKNSKDQLPALKDRIAMLNGWMADVKTGERLTFIHKPGAGLQVDVNGAVKGTIKGDDFAKAFLVDLARRRSAESGNQGRDARRRLRLITVVMPGSLGKPIDVHGRGDADGVVWDRAGPCLRARAHRSSISRDAARAGICQRRAGDGSDRNASSRCNSCTDRHRHRSRHHRKRGPAACDAGSSGAGGTVARTGGPGRGAGGEVRRSSCKRGGNRRADRCDHPGSSAAGAAR